MLAPGTAPAQPPLEGTPSPTALPHGSAPGWAPCGPALQQGHAVPCRAILLRAMPQDAAVPQSWQTTARSPPAPLTLSKADETMWWISEDTWEWLMALAAGHP